MTHYRVRLAREARDWAEAERLQRVCVEWDRREAAPLLARPPESLSANEKNTIRTLAASSGALGQILRDQGKPECVQAITEQYELNSKFGDTAGSSIAAFNLGHAYKDLPALRDLDEAGRWYGRSLELRAEGDRKGRAITVGQLGIVAWERFQEARKEGKTKEELSEHLNSAAGYYRQGLALLPADAVDDLAVAHNQLGGIYFEVNDLERTLYHSNQCIHYMEIGNNIHGAGTIRGNIARALAQNGRLPDALLYARAALRNYESYGGRAGEDEEDTKRLIEWIEGKMKENE